MFYAVWRGYVLEPSAAQTVKEVEKWLDREGYTRHGQPKRAGMNLGIVRIDHGLDHGTAT